MRYVYYVFSSTHYPSNRVVLLDEIIFVAMSVRPVSVHSPQGPGHLLKDEPGLLFREKLQPVAPKGRVIF